MLNELGTNAVKHGVLGDDEGRLTFDWKRSGETITFTWEEHLSAPRIEKVIGTGFGSKILKKIVPMDLQGKADHIITLNGLSYSVSGKSDRVLQLMH